MTAPLRVAVLARGMHPLHGRGGLERHVHDLVTHLAARGVELTVITPPPRTGAAPPPSGGGAGCPPMFAFVPYRTFPLAGRRGTTIADRNTAYLWFGWRAGRLAATLAAAGRIDIVHGLGASVLGYAVGPPVARRVPLVFNPQGLEEFGASTSLVARLKRLAYRPLQHAVRRCAAAADVVVATDDVLVPTVERYLRVDRASIRTIPNAVDLTAVDAWVREPVGSRVPAAGVRRPGGAAPDETIVLSVGRLEANKGFHVLAEALATLGPSPAASPWRWVVVGDGPYRRRLTRRVTSLGLGGRVTFAGRVSDRELHAWYRAAAIFVHPTLYEGSSLVTLEAMAHGRPVVATTAGGLPDKVQPGVTGWLVDPGQPRPLAAAVGAALAMPRPELAAMGARGRALVEARFAWPAVTERLLAVYDELVARGTTGGGTG